MNDKFKTRLKELESATEIAEYVNQQFIEE